MLIAVDAMGGDRAPAEPVRGAALAARELGIEIALVGPQEVLQAELGRLDARQIGLSVVPAEEVIGMDESPAQAVRQKRRSSIHESMRLVKDGRAVAAVSAGNTGAVMAAALFELGRLGNIERPALGGLFPFTKRGVLMLDVGANADCKASYLVQFAHMGSVYVEKVFGVERPSVGLFNIGEEEGKGGELAREVYPLLSKTELNFVGNVEAKEVTRGDVDVVVTDGFTGNVAMKLSEGVAEFIMRELRQAIASRPHYGLGALLLRGAFGNLRQRLDYAEYGGVPLLGVNGVVVIAHGRSSATAIKNAIRTAHQEAKSAVLEAMRAALAR